MPSHTAVRIDDDFATGQSGVALRSADHKASTRIDDKAGLLVEILSVDDRADDVLGHGLH